MMPRLFLLLPLLLLGCRASAPPSGAAPGGPAAAASAPRTYSTADDLYAELAQLPPAELEARLLAGARAEGVIRLYSAYNQELTTDLKRAFEATYPGVKLEFVQGVQTDIKSRVQSEFRAGR